MFSTFTAQNAHTMDIWHSQLGHLGKQNIMKLVGMATGMDLSQPLPFNTCIPCTHSILQVETHTMHLAS